MKKRHSLLLLTIASLTLTAAASAAGLYSKTTFMAGDLNLLGEGRWGEFKVYSSHRIVMKLSTAADENKEYNSEDSGIVESGSRTVRKVILPKRRAGRILEDLSTREYLYVTYSKTCEEKACAFGYYLNAEGAYLLSKYPEFVNLSVSDRYSRRYGVIKSELVTKFAENQDGTYVPFVTADDFITEDFVHLRVKRKQIDNLVKERAVYEGAH